MGQFWTENIDEILRTWAIVSRHSESFSRSMSPIMTTASRKGTLQDISWFNDRETARLASYCLVTVARARFGIRLQLLHHCSERLFS